jgi:protein-disulfide isomerase
MILDLLNKHNIEASFEKIVDIQEMTKYGFVLLPALIINGKVKSHGYLPKVEQIISWLNKG